MLTIARATVPVAIACLLLTACGGSKAGPPSAATAPAGQTLIGRVPDGAAVAPMAGVGTSGSSAAGAGIDAVAPVAGMKATLPVTAAAPVLSADDHTITTRGVGKATGTPDTLTLVIGVSTQDSSAKAALNANNGKANALIELLRGKGVADKDLQTRQLSISPTYNDKSGTITGYQVDNTVQATLHDIASAGALLDAAAGVVGNAVRVEQVGFSIGDDSALRAQARAQAVSRAKDQAGQIAKAAGVTLGRIRSITEVLDAGSPITYDVRAAAGAAAAPIQPGQQELTIAVDIVYDMS